MFRKFFLVLSVTLFFAAAICAQGISPATSTTTTATMADKPKKGPVFRPTKDQIKQVQTMLKSKKLYDGEASGTYNDPTRTGIKSFQKESGLKETGTLNRATLEKFGVELTDNQKMSRRLLTTRMAVVSVPTGTAAATNKGSSRPAWR